MQENTGVDKKTEHNEAETAKKFLNLLFKPYLAVSFGICALVLAISLVIGYQKFGITAVLVSLAGTAALILLAGEIYSFLYGKVTIPLLIGFVFRLACFGIFLYIILVVFKLSAAGAGAGLVMPLISASVALFLSSSKL